MHGRHKDQVFPGICNVREFRGFSKAEAWNYMIIIKGYIKARSFNFALFSVSRLWSPYQGAGGAGGGRYMFPWSLNVFWFYPLFPINNTTCSLKCFKLSFPWSQKLLHCSLDPQECLSLFPIFVCLCYLLFMVEKNRFQTACFFSMESAHAVLRRLQFLSSQLSQLPLR